MKDVRGLQDFIIANKSKVNIRNKLPGGNNKSQETAIAYNRLLNYHHFENHLKQQNTQLKNILIVSNSLEQPLIKEWINKNIYFFETSIFNFGIDYLDENDIFRIPVLEEKINTTNFTEIILFWKCMWLLYFGEYHKDKTNRSPKDEVGSYYYSVSNTINDNEILKNYLNIA